MKNYKRYPDYILLKDLPDFKKGCILSFCNVTKLYYIFSVDVHNIELSYPLPSKNALIKFNIFTITNNIDWFLEVSDDIQNMLNDNKSIISIFRELKLNMLLETKN